MSTLILSSATVTDSFDHAGKAYWMTRDPALNQAVDTWLERSLRTGHYKRALRNAFAGNP